MLGPAGLRPQGHTRQAKRSHVATTTSCFPPWQMSLAALLLLQVLLLVATEPAAAAAVLPLGRRCSSSAAEGTGEHRVCVILPRAGCCVVLSSDVVNRRGCRGSASCADASGVGAVESTANTCGNACNCTLTAGLRMCTMRHDVPCCCAMSVDVRLACRGAVDCPCYLQTMETAVLAQAPQLRR